MKLCENYYCHECQEYKNEKRRKDIEYEYRHSQTEDNFKPNKKYPVWVSKYSQNKVRSYHIAGDYDLRNINQWMFEEKNIYPDIIIEYFGEFTYDEYRSL